MIAGLDGQLTGTGMGVDEALLLACVECGEMLAINHLLDDNTMDSLAESS